MSGDSKKVKDEARACLGKDSPVGELAGCVAKNFPDVEAYREMDDLVIRGGEKFLVVRRIGADRFHVADNVAVPSTNLVDFGGGAERTLDQLIDEIATLAR